MVLAGCNSQEDTSTETPNRTPTATPTEAQTPTATPADSQGSSGLAAISEEFLSSFIDQEYTTVVEMLSDTGEATITLTVPADFGEFSEPTQAIQRAWQALSGQYGTPQTLVDVTIDESEKTATGTIECESGSQQIQLIFTEDNSVSRVRFSAEYTLPEYSSPSRYEERSVTFESGDKWVSGTLWQHHRPFSWVTEN